MKLSSNSPIEEGALKEGFPSLGCEDVNEEEGEGHREKQTNAATVSVRLPELNKEDKEFATTQEKLEWVEFWMSWYMPGQLQTMEDGGIILQKVDDSTVRCVSVVDHPFCYLTLSLVSTSFERRGVSLEIDPYTIVTPYTPPEDRDPERYDEDDEGSDPGVEVV